MNFQFSKEHQLMLDLYKKFVENEIKPIAAEIDEEERFPVETVQKYAKYGFLGIPFSEKYGGQGADVLAYALLMEEAAKVCATSATILGAHISLCAGPIDLAGTEEQKQKYLVPLCKGEKLGAFALTEPGAGSDSAMQQTKAVLDGDEYVINGTKIFITNGSYADTYVVLTMTNPTKGTRGVTAFIIEKGTPGFTFGKKEKKLGIRGSATVELIFENCRVPKENMLGKEGEGFKIAMKTLESGRIGVAAQALGIAEGAWDETLKYVKERKQFGKKISQFQNTQFEMVEMKAQIEACRMLVYQAACAKEAGEPYGHLSAMAKYKCSELASDVTRRCVQLMGGCGFMREYPLERMMRDAKITEIYEGTTEIQKTILAGYYKIK